MEDDEVVASARSKFKSVLIVNVLFLMVTMIGGYVGGAQALVYFATFYVIECVIFLVFFIPVLVYQVLKGRTFKTASAKAMLCFGDFYRHMGSW